MKPGSRVRFRFVVGDTCVTADGIFIRRLDDRCRVFDGSVTYDIPCEHIIDNEDADHDAENEN